MNEESVNKLLIDFVKKFEKNSDEWWSYELFLHDIFSHDDITEDNFFYILSEIQKILVENKISKGSYLEIIIHTKNENILLENVVINISEYINLDNNVEINLHTNNQVFRRFLTNIASPNILQPLQFTKQEKLFWFYSKWYIHIYIFPEDNKLYFLNEWLYGKDIDYVMKNKLYKDF
jgi:hypothetical protein